MGGSRGSAQAVEGKGKGGASAEVSFERFKQMIPNCLEYARAAKASGRPVVGIMCEYTPRELIMAAGAVPVCLCGGSVKTVTAAERDLPSNLCPLIKSTYGYHVLGSNPFMEMADLIVADTTCDGKKKMFELMGQTRAMYVLELPQKPYMPDAVARWRKEFERLKEELEQRFGVKITDEKIRQAIGTMNRERRLRRGLAAMMRADDPPLLGRQLLDLKSSISGIPEDLAEYEKIAKSLAGRRGGHGDRVRVLLTGVPTAHGAERVVELIEAAGGLVVAMENCTGLKPILDDVDETVADPLEALARKYVHLPCAVMTDNHERFEILRRLARDFRPACVVELIWQACLAYDVESYFTRRLTEQELKLGYLRIETDYSPSDSARITTRLEALFETVRARNKKEKA